jgi:hypothetical protein
MATAVIGGIIVSTVLSLVIVPSFFLIMDDLSRLFARLFRGISGAREEEVPQPTPEELAERLTAREADLAALQARVAELEQAPKRMFVAQ